ncbi:MAG: L-threonylcarbamoyladenylate synthase [Bacteroidia bacterium]
MITKPTEIALDLAAQIIQQGGLVSFPTETVYGLGADAFNPAAVAKIFSVKNRPEFDPVIVHISRKDQLESVCRMNKRAEKLIEKFWPGPLTLVLPKRRDIPDIVTAGLLKVGVRMPNNEIALRLITLAGTPLAAPSANPFGYLSPTTAEHVYEQLGSKIDMILDGGPCKVGIESTIIEFSDTRPILLRAGGISVEEITEEIGKVQIAIENGKRPQAPGQLPYHYAPKTRLKIVQADQMDLNTRKKAGFLFFQMPKKMPRSGHYEVLSKLGMLDEAATNLFSALHKLDAAGLEVIYAEPVPEEGLGRAIMDRLRKAEKKKGSKLSLAKA